MDELRLDHIGVQVRDLETAIATFTTLFGYRQATVPVVNSLHNTRGVFLERSGSLPIKLITPQPGSGDTRFGTHHLGFLTDDIDGAVAQLQQHGARLLTAPARGEMFDDEPIAFLFAAGTTIEVVTTRRWRGRLASQTPADGAASVEGVP